MNNIQGQPVSMGFGYRHEDSTRVPEIGENPTLDEIWDKCVRNFLYDQNEYVNELVRLFEVFGISRRSRLADVSAGGGFPAINLIKLGYDIDCFDGFADTLFNANAQAEGVDARCRKKLWKDLPDAVTLPTYDLVFCRGNSFIFAGGGWEELDAEIDLAQVKAKYADTMKIFAGLIKEGGFLYIDKFKDAELGHREKLGAIKVGGRTEEVIFSSERGRGDHLRRVYVERIVGESVVDKETRITYDLSGPELVAFMRDAGFKSIKTINGVVPEETHFDVWLAEK